jgi:hypothetical protein
MSSAETPSSPDRSSMFVTTTNGLCLRPGYCALLKRKASQNFDVLILDAFNSDAVPVHLLTDEAIALYLKHIKPNGLIAFQVTNRHLDLVSVVARHAMHRKFHHALIHQDTTIYSEKTPSAWFLMSQNLSLLDKPSIQHAKRPLTIEPTDSVWTDHSHNLFQILRRRVADR